MRRARRQRRALLHSGRRLRHARALTPLRWGVDWLAWVLVWVAVVLAAMPLFVTLQNLNLYRPPPRPDPTTGDDARPRARTWVLIPARDEADGIGACVEAVLDAASGTAASVLVLDDHSTDGTADVVEAIARREDRVRLLRGAPLPGGWSGKQHACQQLADAAEIEAADGRPRGQASDVLVFLDADVRLAPGSLSRLAGTVGPGVGLASGVPRQITGSWLERLIVPQILTVLLGYLPMVQMRKSLQPGLGAGCGQLFVVDAEAYRRAGGHAAIKASFHDGVHLPRAFRRAGVMTGLFDATPLAVCRMYDGAAATWQGFAKNATSGMAGPAAIVPWTLLLLGGWVLPWVLLAVWLAGSLPAYSGLLVVPAVLMNTLNSGLLSRRFRQGWRVALLRPLGVLVLVALQWYALTRKILGVRSVWRGRAAPA